MGATVSRLGLLQNRHAGQRCVLVANGPSLNHMDLSFLKRETTIGMNKIYLGLRKFRFYPRYYVSVNHKVIGQSVSDIKALNCTKFLGSAGANGLLNEDALTYLVNTQAPGARFCKDLALEGMHEGWTVTYAALQVAYYLGFTTVIIIGMDHRFQYTGNPNESKIMEGPDSNHFCSDYFGHGQNWDNPDLENSEASYRIAREVYEADGRQVIDATIGGACNIFEKADYRTIFKCN
ncbi:6-hydroxymethylpterin diphosphokinase MptE-like protein [Gilvimarinus sp. 1_MG-2023]|uniref:6-hydroxymethylpterin diphosphokinase MptE-like protein n=1 Tax=Gilvimarinus sp. 1_MG-2023 TaxID=3062638 RepID=UPI0026E1EA9F|nr:6-hydroxymethylpterin diphosphokinase MptE-like protein [Gilvimarinus sp. 1_MG-2023]MDO6746290.1 DUF115 domain-containing protein [Gilvimarinus sp. 1_MG-2023]